MLYSCTLNLTTELQQITTKSGISSAFSLWEDLGDLGWFNKTSSPHETRQQLQERLLLTRPLLFLCSIVDLPRPKLLKLGKLQCQEIGLPVIFIRNRWINAFAAIRVIKTTLVCCKLLLGRRDFLTESRGWMVEPNVLLPDVSSPWVQNYHRGSTEHLAHPPRLGHDKEEVKRNSNLENVVILALSTRQESWEMKLLLMPRLMNWYVFLTKCEITFNN